MHAGHGDGGFGVSERGDGEESNDEVLHACAETLARNTFLAPIDF
jgi:hypothetical protein